MESNHPYVELILYDLGKLYLAQSKYVEAETCFQRTLAIQEERLKPEHPEVAPTLEHYADLLRKTGRETEAATLEARAQVIRAKQE